MVLRAPPTTANGKGADNPDGNKGRKRGRKGASRRANKHRDARIRSNNLGTGAAIGGDGNNYNINKSTKLTFDETTRLMDKRERKGEEINYNELDSLIAEHLETPVTPSVWDDDYCQKVSTTKVPIHGTLKVQDKHEDAIRFFSTNINSMNMWSNNNYKADRLKHVVHHYQVDSVGLQEVCVNWSKYKSSHTLASLLRHGHQPLRSVASYNKLEGKNKAMGRTQRGGTATIIGDQLSSYVKDSGVDHTGLGRWSWYLLEGSADHRTRVITAYAPCGGSTSKESTVFSQHHRYIQKKGLKTNPKKMFGDDLLAALRRWKGQGDRLVLMMDANENVLQGHLCRQLQADDIDMVEVVHDQVPGEGPKTWFRGKESIDGIWATRDLDIIGASYLPFDAELGDHRPVVLDITTQSVLGGKMHRIVPPAARRLNSKVKRVRRDYNSKLEQLFKSHNIYERLVEIERDASFPIASEAKAALEALDRTVSELMHTAEKGCRKLRAQHYDFSPEVRTWIDRCHAYKQLIGYHTAPQNMNVGNMKRFARRCGIPDPLSLQLSQLVVDYKACRAELKLHMAKSGWLRQQYLTSRLQEEIGKKNQENADRLQEILRNEAQKKVWRGIHRVTKPNRNGSAVRVEVPQKEGPPIVCDTKETVEAAIAGENSKRFGMANSAPICQGALFELLGYSANTETAERILDGTWEPPDDTDGPTLIILKEIGRIWKKMQDGEVDIVISQEDFQHYWRRAKERTSSSFSGLHMGHYKAASYSDFLSRTHALKLSIITRTGSAPDRWARGLNVMLEKVAGIALVTKLRAILLMEADFNYHNKLIFGRRMMDLARKHDMVPGEIYSEKGHTSEDAILHQVLTYDIARQLRRPLIVASVDASQCYDRVAHAMAALCLRAYKVRQSSVFGMLNPIQCMEYYLRTGHGESDSFFGGKGDRKQGLCQGNGAAPPTWQQISSVMINIQRQRRHGITIRSPISRKEIRQVGILYVDDTNLWAGMEEDDDALSASYKAQRGVDCWGGSLVASGGDLNPDKCSYTISDYQSDGKGGWKYSDHKEDKQEDSANASYEDDSNELDYIHITVPTNSSDAQAIDRLRSSEAVENLGLFTTPDGNNLPHLEQIQGRTSDWSLLIKQGHLPTRSVWASYTHQLWSGLKYGLGASSAPLSQLEGTLGTHDFYMLSKLGVMRSIKTPLRYIPPYFCGIGLFSLTTEATGATINSFLQHYGTTSYLGQTLSAALEHLQLELGVQRCPLSYDFDTWGNLATHSWVKSLWEKIWTFKLDLEIDYPSLPLPRERDKCIMEELVMRGYRGKTLAMLNRARKRQEAVFMSCISTASGTRLDETYMHDWHDSPEYGYGKHRSRFEFGLELPTQDDWDCWRQTLRSVTHNGNHPTSLGSWVSPSPRIWRTFMVDSDNYIEVETADGIDIYPQQETRARRFRFGRRATYASPRGYPVTVEHPPNEEEVLRVQSHSGLLVEPQQAEAAASFIDHLEGLGGAWMWDNLVLAEDLDWLGEAMQSGSLMAVTDGSYKKDVRNDICGAGWIIFCTNTGMWVSGSFAEQSSSANSYRGELLGMLAINLFLLAYEEYHNVSGAVNDVFCDNKGAVFTFSKSDMRISSGSKHGDIRRVLRTVRTRMKTSTTPRHVKAHQDDFVDRSTLPLPAQLNCFCDDLAKRAVNAAILSISFATGRLPLEQAALSIDGDKQTTDVCKGLRHHIGRRAARALFQTEGIMLPSVFDIISWNDIKSNLQSKPRMYQLWYGKQCSGYCGTGKWLGRWDENADTRCPNCGIENESAEHLNVCESTERTLLMARHVTQIESWMDKHCTDPELRRWLPLYIAHRGNWLMTDLGLGKEMSSSMRDAATAQDAIGWRHFTEGKIATAIRDIQELHLISSPTRLSIGSWMKQLINELLQLTHSQWIFRNITKHHQTRGTLHLRVREDILTEIERQLDLGLGSLPAESKFLLEIPSSELLARDTEKQQYWLYAIEAARTAASNALAATGGETNSWETIKQNNGLAQLPTFNPPPRDTTGTNKPEVKQPKVSQSRVVITAEDIKKATSARQHAAAYRTKKKAAEQRRPTSISSLSPHTIASDSHNLFSDLHFGGNLSRQQKTFLQSQFYKRTPRAIQASSKDPTTIRHQSDSVTLSGMSRFQEGHWLSDDSINYFFKHILQPSARNTHCYSSFFFSLLLNNSTDPDKFDFSSVHRWHRRVNSAIFDLDSLLVPINRHNNHWLLLQVRFHDKTVVLHDSLGNDPDNEAYGPSMVRYLYEVARTSGLTNQSLSQWKATWTVTNPNNSPRQLNSYDCGIFTMTTGALLSQGCCINRQSYTQNDLYYYNVRQRMAFLIWEHGRVRRGQIISWLPSNPTPAASPPPKLPSPTRAGLKRAAPPDSPRSRTSPDATTTPTTGHIPVSLVSPRRSPRKRRPPPQAAPAPITVTPSTSTTKRKRKPIGTLPHRHPDLGAAPEPPPKRSAKSAAKQFCISTGVPQCFFSTPRPKRKPYPIFDSCKRTKR